MREREREAFKKQVVIAIGGFDYSNQIYAEFSICFM